MSNIFNQVKIDKVGSNTFDLSHDVKLTTQFGRLTPVCVVDTIPGDIFDIEGNALVRLAPMLAPVMHRADVYIHYFFVPNRITWPGWKDFITAGTDGNNNNVPPTITIISDDIVPSQLDDYMGLPTVNDIGPGKTMTVSALPYAAFQMIFNEYYRDQNLEDEVVYELSNGSNTANLDLRRQRNRAWGHDYFTSALPWTQRGDEVMLPLGDNAPLERIEDGAGNTFQIVRYSANHNPVAVANSGFETHSGPQGHFAADTGNPNPIEAYVDVASSHVVDLSGATAATINDLRRAIRLQAWMEKNARGGSRYNEHVAVHFGVRIPDARVQRPEFIGGTKSPIKFSEVLQTGAAFSGGTPQGNMAGHGISVSGGGKSSYHCTEHGYIIGILSCLPKTAYQQGIPKHFLRDERLDYAYPEFAHLGEQPIENRELYVTGTQQDTETFGYVPRFSEYKFVNNRVAGYFRTSLDFWHIGRKFSSLPPLNENFIKCTNAETDRIFAVQGPEDNLWIQILNNITVKRKLPIFGTPRL